MRLFYGSQYISTPWEIRFWTRVKKTVKCWVWMDSYKIRRRFHDRRAQFKDSGKWHNAARFLWIKLNGPTGDLQVLHTCDNPMCVRPSHLFLGTQLDNIADMKSKGASSNYLPTGRGKYEF